MLAFQNSSKERTRGRKAAAKQKERSLNIADGRDIADIIQTPQASFSSIHSTCAMDFPRRGGRKTTELRALKISLDGLARADGSARFAFGTVQTNDFLFIDL